MKYSYSRDRSRAISFETRQSSHVNLVIYTHLLNKAKDDSVFYLVFLHLNVNSKQTAACKASTLAYLSRQQSTLFYSHQFTRS